jgi:hypothetical protein
LRLCGVKIKNYLPLFTTLYHFSIVLLKTFGFEHVKAAETDFKKNPASTLNKGIRETFGRKERESGRKSRANKFELRGEEEEKNRDGVMYQKKQI